MHWAGGNPFHHHQQLNRLVEGWQKPDTVIVQDIWWTAAAKMADIVLPVTSSLERNDIGGSSRDRYVLAMHQAIAPQHQARNDFDIFADLAERLGYRERFTENRGERAWIEDIYRQCGAAQRRAGVAWPEFEDFWRRGYVELPAPAKEFVFLTRSAPIRRLTRFRRPAARSNCSASGSPVIATRISLRIRSGGRRSSGWGAAGQNLAAASDLHSTERSSAQPDGSGAAGAGQ